jgi:hypothetical protein
MRISIMASQRQIEANRRNAQKSTGPKTERGKDKARLNALTHGMRARVVGPVLPHEDPCALAQRIQRWTDDWQPQNEQEAELVCHAARLSWQIDRAERFETAHLSHRVRKARRRAAGARDLKRIGEAVSIGRELLLPGSDGSRAVLVASLEATREGCRWLMDRWLEIEAVDKSGAQNKLVDLFRFIHLLGKDAIEAVTDPALNALLVAWDVLRPGLAQEFWKEACAIKTANAPSCSSRARWRELSRRPDSAEEAAGITVGVRAQQVDRLKRLLAEHEQVAAEDAVDLLDRAAFDPSAGFERHRRYRATLGREMLRTLDTLRKMRKDGYQVADAADDSEPVGEEKEADKIGILSHEEADKIGILSHEEADKIGILSHEEADKIGILSHEEADKIGILSHEEADKIGILSHEEADKIGILSHEEADKIGILSHEEADKIGILSHEEEETSKSGSLLDEETKPEKAPNEAKSPSAQPTVSKGVTSENGSASFADRSQFPVPLGGNDLSQRPQSTGQVGDSTSCVEEAIQPDGFSAGHARNHDRRSRWSDLDGSTTERLPRLGKWI